MLRRAVRLAWEREVVEWAQGKTASGYTDYPGTGRSDKCAGKLMVLEGGVEPPCPRGAPDFESGASASSATPAGSLFAGRQGTPILADTIPPHNTPPAGNGVRVRCRWQAEGRRSEGGMHYWLTACAARSRSRWKCARSSYFPKIILPAVVCRTLVTAMSMVLEIIFLALSTTTIVPSSRYATP